MNGTIVIDALPVPGPDVRREYLKLPHDLAALARGFGISLPARSQGDAAVLAFAIECADRFLDDLPEADRRARFSADVLGCLGGETVCREALPRELAGWLARLKEVAERRGVSGPFCEIIRELFRNSERMRATRNHNRFVACAVREGRLMVELLLLVLAGMTTPAFDAFMRRLAGPANLGDKFRDALRDFERGEIAVVPTLRFRTRLLSEIFRGTLGVACHSGVNWRVAGWGIHSLFTELIWFRFSKVHSR